MGVRLGSGYIGSTEVETSTANKEVVPTPPANWTMRYNFYKFSFHNDQACKVIINNRSTIFLRAGQGFDMSEVDWPIYSFIIIEPNINYNWIGAY